MFSFYSEERLYLLSLIHGSPSLTHIYLTIKHPLHCYPQRIHWLQQHISMCPWLFTLTSLVVRDVCFSLLFFPPKTIVKLTKNSVSKTVCKCFWILTKISETIIFYLLNFFTWLAGKKSEILSVEILKTRKKNLFFFFLLTKNFSSIFKSEFSC